jgi:hypothetical protein
MTLSEKTERRLFYFQILLHCLPVLLFKYFVTHDGPAHAYNAYLLKSFLFQNDPVTLDFFSLRTFPEANWIGHALMLVLNFIFPMNVAERIVLLTFIILLPVAFRKIICYTNPESSLLSFLIFPFIYSYAFYGGLYNFMLGMPALLFLLMFLLKQKIFSTKTFIILFFSGMLLYFSHLVVFGIFILIVIVYFSICIFKKENATGVRIVEFKKLIYVLLALLPGIVLSAIFLLNKISIHGSTTVNHPQHLFRDLLIVFPTIALDDKQELAYAVLFGAILIVLALVTIYYIVKKKANGNKSIHAIFWFTISALMLLFYFIIPDDIATGGVVKVRFAYFFFFFFICWIATQRLPGKILLYAAVCITLVNLAKIFQLTKTSKQLNDDAVTVASSAEFIEPNSVVLPLNYSSNWMHSNLSNYIGADNHIIILDNYEAGREHFPLKWNSKRNPVELLGSFNGEIPLCANVSEFETISGKKIDYILVWKRSHELNDSCSNTIRLTIREKYGLIFKTLDKQLYLYKRL